MNDNTTTETAALRDRIAHALEREDALHWGYDHGFADRYGADAETDGFVDAVLAELPAPADDLATARATSQRLNRRAQALESELAAYRRAVGQWEINERGTYIPHSSLRAIGLASGKDILGSVRHLKHFERVEQAEAAIEDHRLALSEALGLGTGAPWGAIRDRAAELAAQPAGADRAAARVEAIAAVEDPTERAKTTTGLGLGWEAARDVLRRLGGEAAPDNTETPSRGPASDCNSGPGWYEVISPRNATTCIALVHEDGTLYLPEGEDTLTADEFSFAAARGNAHRLVRADEVQQDGAQP